MSTNIIFVEELNHSYASFKKEDGFLHTLKDFFNRRKTYSPALENISFSVKEGEIIGLLGPNGAGKTTLLKILSGLIYPTSGNVNVINKNPYKKEKTYLRQIGVVMGQKSQLLWDIPALDTLKIIAEIYGVSKVYFNDRLDQFIELLSIGHCLHTPVRSLSLGERMKFELIASLIHNPKILFLDEPTIGLDLVSQRAIRDFLTMINQMYQTTIIITSHYMRDIEILAERLMIIKKGKIFYNGSLKQLLKDFNPAHKIRFSTVNDDFSSILNFEKIAPQQYCLSCQPHELKNTLAEIVTQIPIINLKTEEQSLEETIFSIFNDKSC